MVGQDKGIGRARPGSLTEITSKLIGKPYALGITGKGFDCFNSVYSYLQMKGIFLPDEFRGLTLKNYADLYLKDPDGAKRIMEEFIETILPEIDPAHAFAGDVLLLKLKDELSLDSTFLGIHAGGTNVICATEEHGVSIYPMHDYTIVRAFSCRERRLYHS